MLLTLTWILAAAGGGSGGFGGGGGGGGFSGGGGGGGGVFVGGGGGGGGGGFGVFLVILVVIALVMLSSAMTAVRYRRRRGQRAADTALAAREAAEDDADFDPDNVRTQATALFVEVQRRWSAGDREGLAELVGPDLMVEWGRRLDDFRRKGWRNVVEVRGTPSIEYLGLVNREGEDEDRVVVRIDASLMDYVIDSRGNRVMKDSEQDESVRLREWWTLHPPGERWRVVSIEQEVEGRHHLTSQLVAVPWADARVGDEALVETAAGDAAVSPAGSFRAGELVDADLAQDARVAALDLSLVDARFAPDVLAVSARRAVAAWVEAVDGSDEALMAIAEPGAIAELLYAGDATRATRVVLRGAEVERIDVARVDGEARPPAMEVEVSVGARRYVENRDTADIVSGSRDTRRTFRQRWRFALGDDPRTPWRLAGVTEL